MREFFKRMWIGWVCKIMVLVMVFVVLIYLSVFAAFPFMFLGVRWLLGEVLIGVNLYLAHALTWAIAFLITWFVFRYVLRISWWDKLVSWLGINQQRKFKGYTILALIPLVYFLSMWSMTQNRWFLSDGTVLKGTTMDPLTGQQKEQASPRGITERGERIIPFDPDRARAFQFQEQIVQKLGPKLNEYGELDREFIRHPDNLDRLPWVDHTNGKPRIYYCFDLENNIRLYGWVGRCMDGNPRKPISSEIQKLLYQQARGYQKALREKVEQEQLEQKKQEDALVKARAEVLRLSAQLNAEKSYNQELEQENSQQRKEIKDWKIRHQLGTLAIKMGDFQLNVLEQKLKVLQGEREAQRQLRDQLLPEYNKALQAWVRVIQLNIGDNVSKEAFPSSFLNCWLNPLAVEVESPCREMVRLGKLFTVQIAEAMKVHQFQSMFSQCKGWDPIDPRRCVISEVRLPVVWYH